MDVMRNQTVSERNQRLYLLNYLLLIFGGGLCAEGYLQAFMLEGGMDVHAIGLYGMLVYVAGIAAYVLFPLLKPRNGSYLGFLKLTSLASLIYPIGLTLLGFSGLSTAPACAAMLGLGMCYSFLTAIRSSSEFSTVPELFPRSVYGTLTGKGGVIGGAVAMLVSMLGAYFLQHSDKMTGYRIFFALAAVIFGVAAAVAQLFRRAGGQAEVRPTLDRKLMLKKLFSRSYALTLLPHFLRGLGMAGMYYFVIIAVKGLSLTTAQNTGLVTVGVCTKMLGSFLFMKTIKRVRSGRLILAANLLCAVCMLLVTTRINVPVFFALYLLYGTADIISQTGVPVGIMYCTPEEELPLLSAARMLVCNCASCLALPLFGAWVENGFSLAAMAVSGAFFAIAGVIFCRQYQDGLKEE